MDDNKLALALVLMLLLVGLVLCVISGMSDHTVSCLQASLPVLLLLATYLVASELILQASAGLSVTIKPLRQPPVAGLI